MFHIKLEEKISQHMWLFSTSRTKIRSLQGQQQNLKGIILIENIQKCTYIVNRRWINCCSKLMRSMYCVPEISTEVSVLTSYPQLIQVQSSCAHTLLVLEFQFEPLAAWLNELTSYGQWHLAAVSGYFSDMLPQYLRMNSTSGQLLLTAPLSHWIISMVLHTLPAQQPLNQITM